MKNSNDLKKRILIIILLISALSVTTYALGKETLVLRNNYFATGRLKINLNNGQKLKFKDVNGNIVQYFEPGMRVVSDFFIKNEGTNDMYYRLYFDDML